MTILIGCGSSGQVEMFRYIKNTFRLKPVKSGLHPQSVGVNVRNGCHLLAPHSRHALRCLFSLSYTSVMTLSPKLFA